MSWFIAALKKYAVFGGRSRRREFWYFSLFVFLINIVLTLLDLALGTFSYSSNAGLLGGLFSLGVLVPSVAVTVRRLHDTDRSGWWALIYLVPIVGAIVLLVFAAQDGTSGSNRFGANPKGASA